MSSRMFIRQCANHRFSVKAHLFQSSYLTDGLSKKTVLTSTLDSCRCISIHSASFLFQDSCLSKNVVDGRYSKSLIFLKPLGADNYSFKNRMFHGVSGTDFSLLSKQTSPSVDTSLRRNNSSESSEYKSILLSLFEDLTKSSYVVNIEKYIIKFHDVSGLSWWATVAIMTFTLRLFLTFPLTVYQHYIFAKVENLTGEMNEIVNQLKREANLAVLKLGRTPKQVQQMFRRSFNTQWHKLIVRENCHPAKGIVVLAFQIPIWVMCSAALRNIASGYPPDDSSIFIAAMEMSVGGFAWAPNLLLPDSYYVIPVLFGLTNLLNIELQAILKNKETSLQTIGKNVCRLLILCTVPIAAQMPSVLSFYWLTSSTFGLCQNLLLLSPQVRKRVGIPKTPSTLEHPYLTIRDKCLQKITDGKHWLKGSFDRKS